MHVVEPARGVYRPQHRFVHASLREHVLPTRRVPRAVRCDEAGEEGDEEEVAEAGQEGEWHRVLVLAGAAVDLAQRAGEQVGVPGARARGRA